MRKLLITAVAVWVAVSAYFIIKPMDQLKYPLSEKDKSILKGVLKEQISDVIFDSVWNDYFYYKNQFEALNIDLVTCNAGFGASCPSTSITPDGLVVNTEGTTSGNYGDVSTVPLADSGLRWDKSSRMRTSVYFQTAVTSQTAYLIRGGFTGLANSPFYGFKVVNNSLKGVVYSGSAETTVNLATIVTQTSYILEARYKPDQNVTFYVNEAQVGVIAAGLPNSGNSVERAFYDFYLQTNANAGKTMVVSFFEFIQKK